MSGILEISASYRLLVTGNRQLKSLSIKRRTLKRKKVRREEVRKVRRFGARCAYRIMPGRHSKRLTAALTRTLIPHPLKQGLKRSGGQSQAASGQLKEVDRKVSFLFLDLEENKKSAILTLLN